MKEKLKQKKGFTIVELLAVIVIIAILATLVITSVISYREKAKEEYMNTLKDQLALAAKSYYSDNPKELPRGQVEGDYKRYNTSVKASDLAINNYFTNELVDNEGNSCEVESYVVVSNTNGEYRYQPCLKCKNGEEIVSQSGVCDVPLNNVPYCTVEVQNDILYVKKLIVHTNTTSGVVESTIKAADDGNYYAYKPGTYEFTVKGPDNETATCGVTIYMEEDKEIPNCNATFKENRDGKHIVTFEWIDNYWLKSVTNPVNGTIYNDDYNCSYGKTTKTGGTEFSFDFGPQAKTYTMTVTDCNGNTNTCSYTVPKLNELKCETELVSSSNTTYRVKYTWFDETSLKSVTNPSNGNTYENYSCSGTETKTDSDTFTFYRTTSNKIYTMTVTDCDGNIATCSYTVPRKTTPTPSYPGDSDVCTGSGCDDEPEEEPEEETGCTRVCYAGESSDYDYTTCRYYQCSADGCSGSWRKISGCTVEEDEEYNPGTGCFLEGTKVLTSNGYKNIEDIEIGDFVLSYNIEAKKQVYNKVDYKFVLNGNSDRLYEITVNGEIIKATEHHHFYIMEDNVIKTKAAKDLEVGDYLIDKELGTNKISNIKGYSHFGTVYNLSVENDHNYYVYENAYLVHNQSAACKEDPKLPGCN